MRTIQARQMGEFARQVLQRIPSAGVAGSASRGLYLQAPDDLTLFLSLEEFPGPLTLNLGREGAVLAAVRPGSPALVEPERILFPADRLAIELGQARLWIPGAAQGSREGLSARLEQAATRARGLAGSSPYLPLLETALTGRPAPLPGVPGIKRKLAAALDGLQSGDHARLGDALAALLGLGPGLTPLGDDLVLGVVLTLSRWGFLLPAAGDCGRILEALVEKSLRNTTRLSASLLACAAQGQADQRLVRVLDSFLTGEIMREDCLQDLLQWGSSSGIAVLAGIMMALKQASGTLLDGA